MGWLKIPIFPFFSRALLLARSDPTTQSVMWSSCLSMAGPLPHPLPLSCPPPKHDFWAAQAILSNFCFWEKKKKLTHTSIFFFYPKFFFHPKLFFIQNCFSSQFFFLPLKKFSHFHFFNAFLDVLCYPECSKNFSPKIFLGEARHDTMLPSISSFHNLISMQHLFTPHRKTSDTDRHVAESSRFIQ